MLRVRRSVFLGGLLALAGGWLGRAVAQTLPEIEFGYPELPPTVFTNTSGQPDGYYIHLAAAMFPAAGIKWHAQSYPAARLFANLRRGVTQFSILVRNPDLEADCVFSAAPVWQRRIVVYALANRPPIATTQDLIGQSLITIAGFSYAGRLDILNAHRATTKIEQTSSHDYAFAMLTAGRADYLVDYDEIAEAVLAKAPIPGLQRFEIARLDSFMVLTRYYPNASRVMAQLEAIVAGLDKAVIFKPLTQ